MVKKLNLPTADNGQSVAATDEQLAAARAEQQPLRTLAAQKMDEEKGKSGGLVIVSATYSSCSSKRDENMKDLELDVTIPLQGQVKDSQLSLAAVSKGALPGFVEFSVLKDHVVKLKVRYKVGGGAELEKVFLDTDLVMLP